MNFIGNLLYFLGWIFFRTTYHGIYRAKVTGRKFIPKKGGVLIASNHLSFVDPPLIGASIYRPISYMAKKELFSHPVFGWLLRKVNAFPVERKKSDFGAIKNVKRLLMQGNTVLMFPQGGRRSENDFEVKNGIGMISCWSQVPIVPCCIVNSNKLKEFKRLEVHFMEPVYPPEKYTQADYDSISKQVADKIKAQMHANNEKKQIKN